MKWTKADPTEMVTVLGLIILGGIALWQKQVEMAVGIGGGLVGYLTKSNNGHADPGPDSGPDPVIKP